MRLSWQECNSFVCTTAGCKICEQQDSQSFDALLPVLGIIGAVLFLFSDQLSASTAFRLSSGTAIFTTLSLAILLLFIFRCVGGEAAQRP